MINKGLFIFAFLSIWGLLNGNVIFEDCGSAYELEAVQISGCERSVPCYLTLGAITNVTASFRANFISTSLSDEVYVVLNNVQRETTVSPQACEATYCPVEVEVSALYEAQLQLPTNLALNTRGVLHWQIFNQNSIKVVCFQVTIQTQSPSSVFLGYNENDE